MTPAEFRQALRDAKPGEKVIYVNGARVLGKVHRDIARAALAAYFRGEVELLQRRLSGPFAGMRGGGSTFAWFAVKRHQVEPPGYLASLINLVEGLLVQRKPEKVFA